MAIQMIWIFAQHELAFYKVNDSMFKGRLSLGISNPTLDKKWLIDSLQSEKYDIKMPAPPGGVTQGSQNYLSMRFTFSDFGMLYSPYV